MRDFCLGFECDLDWESLPEDIRHLLINRCLGIPIALTNDQINFLKEKLGLSTGLNFETYQARRDYAAFTGALQLSRASSWVGGDESQRTHTLRHTKSIIDILSTTKPPAKPSLYDRMMHYSGALYHGAGTLCKFFSVAFVADPEYQRELKWTFSEGSKITQTVSQILFNGIWMLAKSCQKILLPAFMVRFPIILLSTANQFSLPTVKTLKRFGKISKGWKFLSKDLVSPSAIWTAFIQDLFTILTRRLSNFTSTAAIIRPSLQTKRISVT